MNLKINTLLSDLNEQLNFIDIEFDDTINRCEKAIEIIIVSIQKLKILFLKEKFKFVKKDLIYMLEHTTLEELSLGIKKGQTFLKY